MMIIAMSYVFSLSGNQTVEKLEKNFAINLTREPKPATLSEVYCIPISES